MFTLGRLLLLNSRPLHSHILDVGQQHVLVVVDIPLLALFDGFDQPHAHDFNSELGLATDSDDPLIDLLELQSFDPLDDGLQLVEIFFGRQLINFGQYDLNIDVIPLTSLQKLYIVVFESVLYVDADKDLRQSR